MQYLSKIKGVDMSMIYVNNDLAKKLKSRAETEKRTVSAVIEIMMSDDEKVPFTESDDTIDLLLNSYPDKREVSLDLLDRGFSAKQITAQYDTQKGKQ